MNKYFRLLIFLLIPLFYLVFQLLTIDQYGETTDHKIILERGEFYFYDYNQVGYQGIYQGIPSAKLRSYGPLYSTIIAASKHYFYDSWQVFSDPIQAYHFPNIIFSTLAILILGIFIANIWGFLPAVLAMIVLITIPRFFGHAQTNYKDISTLVFFLPCVVSLYYAVIKKSIYYWIISGILIGLCYSVRIHALMLIPIISLWFGIYYILPLTKESNSFRKIGKTLLAFLSQIIFCLLIASITVMIVWPYYRVDPLVKFLETFNVMSGHNWTFQQMYLGERLSADQMPWHYPLVYLSLTLPLVYLLLLITGFILSLIAIIKNYAEQKTLMLINICAITPPVAHVLMGTPMYGGIRHWLLVYPFFAALIAYTLWQLIIYAKKLSFQSYVLATVLVVGTFSNQIYQNAKLFPLTYIYFNSLVGGEASAQHLFTLDIRSQARHHVDKWIAQQPGDKQYRVMSSRKFNREKYKKILANQTPVYTYKINGAILAYVFEK